jgi:hypothetical protein
MDAAHAVVVANLHALNAGDEAAYLATFAPEGGVSGPFSGEGLRGPAAVGTLFRQLQSQLAPAQFEAIAFYTRHREGALVWTCVAQPDGRILRFEGITDFSFELGGLIRWGHVFWDPAAMLNAKEGRAHLARSIPELVQTWMAALESKDPMSLRALFSPESTLEGMLTGGRLQGPAVISQHLTHARRQIGGPHFRLEAVFEAEGRAALRWEAEAASTGHRFGGVTILDSADGHHIDRVRMFWDPAEVAG